MSANKTTKSQFCESFPWPMRIHWMDLTGVTKLDNDRMVRIDLVCGAVAQTYIGFRVQILHKRTGLIDQKVFAFDDYLSAAHGDRTDGRTDWGGPGRATFSVVSHVAWDWYIAKPKSTDALTNAIWAYVDIFA